MALTDNPLVTTSTNGTDPSAEPAPIPASIRMVGTPRMTPNELRLLKAVTGRSLEQVMGDEADAMQAMVWLRLRRAGYAPTWEQAGDVEAEIVEPEPVDPTSGGPSPTSPPSVATGG